MTQMLTFDWLTRSHQQREINLLRQISQGGQLLSSTRQLVMIVLQGALIQTSTCHTATPWVTQPLQSVTAASPVLSLNLLNCCCFRYSRDGRFVSKVGQIGPKWDKSGAFSDQTPVHLALFPGQLVLYLFVVSSVSRV